MAKKPYTVKKEINGVEYTAQFNGVAAALESVDSSYIDGTQNISTLKMASYLLEHVIVDPKGLTVNDFDSVAELNAVTDFARDVMHGLFRNQANEGAAAEKN